MNIEEAINDLIILNCRLAYGRISFKFKPPGEEWSITMKHKEAKEKGIIDSVVKDDVVDYGAIVTFKEPLQTEDGEQHIFHHKNILSTEDCRLIWSQLKELGFKPTQQTEKAMRKKGLLKV
jgi:hypothetical protein